MREQMPHAELRALAYCLMSNHVHLVVVAERADSLAILFRRVHGQFQLISSKPTANWKRRSSG